MASITLKVAVEHDNVSIQAADELNWANILQWNQRLHDVHKLLTRDRARDTITLVQDGTTANIARMVAAQGTHVPALLKWVSKVISTDLAFAQANVLTEYRVQELWKILKDWNSLMLMVLGLKRFTLKVSVITGSTSRPVDTVTQPFILLLLVGASDMSSVAEASRLRPTCPAFVVENASKVKTNYVIWSMGPSNSIDCHHSRRAQHAQ